MSLAGCDKLGRAGWLLLLLLHHCWASQRLPESVHI